jgi:hypothetical protein
MAPSNCSKARPCTQRVVFLSAFDESDNALSMISLERDRPRAADGSHRSQVYRCNSTHQTEYLLRPLNDTEHFGRRAIYIHHFSFWDEIQPRGAARATLIGQSIMQSRRDGWYKNYHTLLQPQRSHSLHLAYTLEAPGDWPFKGLEGYDGEATYRRDAAVYMPDGNEGISDPFMKPFEARRMMSLPFNPNRTTIGIWQDNCDSVLRNRVIDLLLASDLDVRSYGRCRRNVDPHFIARGEAANGGVLRWAPRHTIHPLLAPFLLVTLKQPLLTQHLVVLVCVRRRVSS